MDRRWRWETQAVLPLLAGFSILMGCGESDAPKPDAGDAASRSVARTEALPAGAVEVALTPGIPDADAGRTMRWSPYGRQFRLRLVDGGLETEVHMGPDNTLFRLRLTRSGASPYFDRLAIDRDQDGEFRADEVLETTPSETRNKFWSSFDTTLDIPVTDPWTGEPVVNPYPLSFWYVEDPRVEEADTVIRFSRDGWMEGTATLDGVEAAVLVTEQIMDGEMDQHDSWALAPADSADLTRSHTFARQMQEHAWLGQQAYRVVEVDPSGRRVVIEPTDPGMTRAEENDIADHLAEDRAAPRSGRTVAFLHGFEEAEAQAQREGKALLVDFETTWCGPCKIMDEWVWTADAVVDATQAMVAVKVDGDERLDLKDRFEVTGFPTTILLGPGGRELNRASGYVNVEAMTEFLGVAGS